MYDAHGTSFPLNHSSHTYYSSVLIKEQWHLTHCLWRRVSKDEQEWKL